MSDETLALLVDAVKAMTSADWQQATEWPDWTATDLEVLSSFGIHRDPRAVSIGEQVEATIHGLEATPLRRFTRVLTKPTLACFHRSLLADLANPSLEQMHEATKAAIESRGAAAARLQLALFVDEGGRYAAHAVKVLAEDPQLTLKGWKGGAVERAAATVDELPPAPVPTPVAPAATATHPHGADLAEQLDGLRGLQTAAAETLDAMQDLVRSGRSMAGAPAATPVEEYAHAHDVLVKALVAEGVLEMDAPDLDDLAAAVAAVEDRERAERERRERIGRLVDLAPAHGAPVDLDAVAVVRQHAGIVLADGTAAVSEEVLASLELISERIDRGDAAASAAEAFALQQDLVREHQPLALPLLAGGLELAS